MKTHISSSLKISLLHFSFFPYMYSYTLCSRILYHYLYMYKLAKNSFQYAFIIAYSAEFFFIPGKKQRKKVEQFRVSTSNICNRGKRCSYLFSPNLKTKILMYFEQDSVLSKTYLKLY